MVTSHKLSNCELFLFMVAVWWSVVLTFNNHLFDNIPSIYVGIADIAGQHVWALIFFVTASMSILGIIKDHSILRQTSLTISSVLYGLICAGYIYSDAMFHTGTGIYFSLTVLCLLSLREVKLLYAR